METPQRNVCGAPLAMLILTRSDCAVLPLVLTAHWYNLIDTDGKREEYRRYTPYWEKRVVNWINKPEPFKVIAFSRGYRAADMFWVADPFIRQHALPETSLHTEWGEGTFVDGESYFAFKLLDRVYWKEPT